MHPEYAVGAEGPEMRAPLWETQLLSELASLAS